ncbi:MAG: electron transport complex subunit RsxA [Spirochaetales bacterium]
MSYVGLLFIFLFTQNVLLYYFLGIDSVEEIQDRRASLLIQEGLVLTGVCSVSATIIRTVYLGVLLPLGVPYLNTLIAVLIILSLVKATCMVLDGFGISLTEWRILVNSLVFGVSLLSIYGKYTLLESFIAGLAAGMGYLLAVYLLEVLLEQFKREWIPRALQGVPILMISAGLMAMAFFAIDVSLLRRIFG